ncbi:MAG: alpha/beta fold hydrolase [Prevotella sp.]|nr:alpha/beta fold hydrolase [Prevotella sp.]
MKNFRLTFVLMLLMAATQVLAQFEQTDDDAKYATELLKPGQQVPDAKLKTPEGKSVKLSKLIKGKWALIDFWASWCPDCRKDMPNVQRMYADFAPRGVEFVGVSFDTEADNWVNAISKYNIRYAQVSDLKKMRDSEVAKAFGVKWIPSMMLIDPQGKVVLSTVLSDKMEKTLTETFAQKRPIDGTTEQISLDGGKGRLAAILQKPTLAQGAQCPMVVFCHGFGGSKEGPLFELIADSLQAHGIASLRFDFNGHGASEGEFVDMTVPNEIEDAMKVIEYVRDLRYVSKVALVGHSQGGVVASMTAGKLEPGDIAAVALMAPAAVLRDDAIRGSTMGANYNPLDPPEFVELWGGKRLGRNYIKTAFSLPIYETAANYQGPALIVHGTGDRVVPYTYGERYKSVWPKAKVEILDAQDHGFGQNIYRATRLVSDFLIEVLR